MARVVVIGAGSHARYVIDTFAAEGRHTVVGALAPDIPDGDLVGGVPVIGDGPLDLERLARTDHVDAVHVAVGDNATRRRIVELVRALDQRQTFQATVHPSVVVGARAGIGSGSVVVAGGIVHTDAAVGQHCYLGARATLEHDSVLGDYASLAPGAVTGGNVRIGRGTAIAIGAVIRHGVTIGEDTVVGAGAVVLDDLPDRVVAYGTPARVVRERAPDDRYL